jgi:hypothetical protein
MIPSATAALFFGGRLRGGKWALGYQFTGSLGLAERYWIGAADAPPPHHRADPLRPPRLCDDRRRPRSSSWYWPAVAELEARSASASARASAPSFGGQLRLGHNFVYGEQAPLPQLGLFFGLSLL